ncbi:MAG: uracil-DNA glycosylase [Acidobacteria bacterium]|nr:MAG: uracil-DNA glycosylase [Acidobacteriota bacterium]
MARLDRPAPAPPAEPPGAGTRPATAPEPVQRPLVVPGFEAEPADREAIEALVGLDDPAEALARLEREVIGDCRRCRLHEKRRNVVFGVGDPRARLMFVGEGPGADEDRLGEPFVGRAGQLLDRILAAMGLDRRGGGVYIANVVKCRPPDNRDPLPDEQGACLPFLAAQIAIIRPEVLVALGRVALLALTGGGVTSLGRVRGRWLDWNGIPLMATYHPAYLLRNPAGKRAVWADMQEVLRKLGLEPPGKGT